MGSLPLQIGPNYGVHPETGSEYFPTSQNGYPSYESQIKRWTSACYEEAVWEHSQNDEIQKVSQQIDYIVGKQWTKKRPSYRSAPVNNRIWGLVWELVSTLTDIRPVFEVREADPDNKQKKDLARKLTQTTRSWWLSNNVDLSLAMGIVYGLLCMGYFKLSWNEELKLGRGDFEVIPLGPNDVLPLKARTDIQQAECVIYRTVQSLGWFRRKFPLRGDLVKPDTNYSNFSMGGGNRPSYFTQSLWDNISPQMKRVMGVEQQTRSSVYPMALYREFWLKDYSLNTSSKQVLMGRPKASWSYMVQPGQPLYPRGRLIVMGGDEWMADIPNPYLHGKFPFGALRLNAVPWQFTGLCYSSDTEVLTKRGWLKFSDISYNDELATRRMHSAEFEWQRPTHITREQYSGPMLNFHSRSTDLMVTPNHRMLVSHLPKELGGLSKWRGGKEGVITAAEFALFGKSKTYIPQTSVWKGTEIGDKVFTTGRKLGKPVRMTGDDYCRFMGAYLSEGWTNYKKTTVWISQSRKSKGFQPFKELVERLVGKNTYYENGNGFAISRIGLADFCQKFGRSYQKYIPEDIMNATPRQIKIFWDYFILGDGWSRKRKAASGVRGMYKDRDSVEQLQTSSKVLADQMVEVCQKLGWSSSIQFRKPRKSPSSNNMTRPLYVIAPRLSKSTQVKWKTLSYEGEIMCATVPNGILYVRRNGKPSWCGNSEVRQMQSMQDVINNVLAGILDMVKKAVNPVFYAPESAFSDSVWDSLDWGMPGAKAAYSPISPQPPAFGPTPNLPSFVFQMLGWAGKEMDRGSGIAAVSEALNKKQVPGGDTLENMRQTQQTPLRLKGRNIEVMLRDLGSMQIHNFFQFYNDRRQLYLPGAKEGIFQSIDWNPEVDQKDMKQDESAKDFEFLLEGGTLLNLNRMERIAMLARLRAMRDIDRRTLIENLDLGLNVDEIEKRLKAEPPPPGPPPKGAARQATAGLPKI